MSKSIVDRAQSLVKWATLEEKAEHGCLFQDEGTRVREVAQACIDFAEALEKNERYWSCVAEMEDPKYCGEYAQIASDATSAVLQKHGVKVGDVG